MFTVINISKMKFCKVCFKSAVKQSYLSVACSASYMMIALLCILLHIVSSLHISIDGNKGNDSIACIKGESSCQSLTYVADTINVSANLKIEIISSSLNLQGSVIFTGINGLTLNGKGANIICKTSPSHEFGIVFRNCSNIWLKGFNIKYCGLYQQKQKYCGLQAILFYNCSNFYVSSVNLTSNNGAGLVLYNSWGVNAIWQSIFKNNSLIQKIEECPGLTGGGGGGLQITQYQNSATTLLVSSCQFINNSAATAGGGIYMHFSTCASFYIFASGVNLTGNTAGVSGGGIGIATYNANDCRLLSTQLGYHVSFLKCNIIDNTAQFGGGVAIQIVHVGLNQNRSSSKEMQFTFHICNFKGNKGKFTSAVDINGSSQKLYDSFIIQVIFQYCMFANNTADKDIQNSSKKFRGKIFKATMFVIDSSVSFVTQVSFLNNIGTALYAINSRVTGSTGANIEFFNNTGTKGGAVYLAEGAVLDFINSKHTISFSNNTAVIGGAIYVQSMVITQYIGTCFLMHGLRNNLTINFNNNTAVAEISDDIFASTLHSCVELYGDNATTLFKNGVMGDYLSLTPQSVATAPVTLLINETQLLPYPGLSYNMSITQLDELNNDITNLQLFPLSATLLNKQSSSLKIILTYSIANNYIIVFKGIVGDEDTLTLQSNEYSATLSISVTLYQCPPGYIFLTDTCHCSYSIPNHYYYGIVHCLEDKNAVITTGLWAGYLQEKFVTADCVTSLCDYHNSTSNRYGEHILPLNYSFLSDHVCALHRTGVLCGSCISDYTTYLHSPSYQCGESTLCQYGPLFYILSEIIPVTGIFLVILFFNINLTSGALYSFIFYSQTVNNHYGNTLYQSYNGPLIYFFNAFKIVYGIFDLEIFEIDQLSFCLFKNATILDLMLIKYLTTLYALFLIIVTILVLRFYSFYCCIKLCHKCGRRNIRGSIVNALTAFLVLCYFHCLVITLHILVPSHIMGEGGTRMKTVPLYNGDLSYMSIDHLKYVIPAIVCLIVIILPPPIILLSEPLLVRVSGVLNIRRNAITYTLHRLRMKLKPFLDSFQGCFKDNCRYFAGLFFLYRILLVLIPIYLSEGVFWNILMKESLLCLILLLHCFCMPFERKPHNNHSFFLLVDLLMINTLQLVPLTEYTSTTTAVAVFQLVLMSLPLIYFLGYIGQYYLRRYKQKRVNLMLVPTEDDDEVDGGFPARLIPELVDDSEN